MLPMTVALVPSICWKTAAPVIENDNNSCLSNIKKMNNKYHESIAKIVDIHTQTQIFYTVHKLHCNL